LHCHRGADGLAVQGSVELALPSRNAGAEPAFLITNIAVRYSISSIYSADSPSDMPVLTFKNLISVTNASLLL
jgi:hypothetical protein